MGNVLNQLPYIKLRARILGTQRWVGVLVDGDYDGEWFRSFEWIVNPAGYVLTSNAPSFVSIHIYLHHLVLPARRGYWRSFKNGNKLDCRSRNLEYVTPSEIALKREWRRVQMTKPEDKLVKKLKPGEVRVTTPADPEKVAAYRKAKADRKQGFSWSKRNFN